MRTPADISRSRTLTWTLFGIAALVALTLSVGAAGAPGGSKSTLPGRASPPPPPNVATQPGIDSARPRLVGRQDAERGRGLSGGTRGWADCQEGARSRHRRGPVHRHGRREYRRQVCRGNHRRLVREPRRGARPAGCPQHTRRDPAVAYVRPPLPHVADVVVNGEEVGASNAVALQAAGISGTGAKVAIVDLGFGGLAQRQADGEIPSSAVPSTTAVPLDLTPRSTVRLLPRSFTRWRLPLSST